MSDQSLPEKQPQEPKNPTESLPYQRNRQNRHENLQKFERMIRREFSGDSSLFVHFLDGFLDSSVCNGLARSYYDGFGVVGETPILGEILEELVLFCPALSEPFVKGVGIFNRDVGNCESTPVHVYGRGTEAFEVDIFECEDVLTVFTWARDFC
jgi:hypothetical protein